MYRLLPVQVSVCFVLKPGEKGIYFICWDFTLCALNIKFKTEINTISLKFLSLKLITNAIKIYRSL
jgi:hypothetical protein